MKVLVAIDLQNDFIDGTLGTREAQNIVSNAVEIIKDFKGTVIATRVRIYLLFTVLKELQVMISMWIS